MVRKANYSDVPAIKKQMKSGSGFWDDSWRNNAVDIGIESLEILRVFGRKMIRSLASFLLMILGLEPISAS